MAEKKDRPTQKGSPMSYERVRMPNVREQLARAARGDAKEVTVTAEPESETVDVATSGAAAKSRRK